MLGCGQAVDMMDALASDPPSIAAPLRRGDQMQELHPVKKRRNRDRRPIPNGVLFVGAIILLTTDSGEAVPCQVVQVQPLLCVPVP